MKYLFLLCVIGSCQAFVNGNEVHNDRTHDRLFSGSDLAAKMGREVSRLRSNIETIGLYPFSEADAHQAEIPDVIREVVASSLEGLGQQGEQTLSVIDSNHKEALQALEDRKRCLLGTELEALRAGLKERYVGEVYSTQDDAQLLLDWLLNRITSRMTDLKNAWEFADETRRESWIDGEEKLSNKAWPFDRNVIYTNSERSMDNVERLVAPVKPRLGSRSFAMMMAAKAGEFNSSRNLSFHHFHGSMEQFRMTWDYEYGRIGTRSQQTLCEMSSNVTDFAATLDEFGYKVEEWENNEAVRRLRARDKSGFAEGIWTSIREGWDRLRGQAQEQIDETQDEIDRRLERLNMLKSFVELDRDFLASYAETKLAYVIDHLDSWERAIKSAYTGQLDCADMTFENFTDWMTWLDDCETFMGRRANRKSLQDPAIEIFYKARREIKEWMNAQTFGRSSSTLSNEEFLEAWESFSQAFLADVVARCADAWEPTLTALHDAEAKFNETWDQEVADYHRSVNRYLDCAAEKIETHYTPVRELASFHFDEIRLNLATHRPNQMVYSFL